MDVIAETFDIAPEFGNRVLDVPSTGFGIFISRRRVKTIGDNDSGRFEKSGLMADLCLVHAEGLFGNSGASENGDDVCCLEGGLEKS
jgi:hypothetical protein